jgi:hypothetical protein
MPPKNLIKHPLALLNSTLRTLVSNPAILFPFCILAFIQILILQVLFFAPRYEIFKPLVMAFDGEIFLHYPFNFIHLVKWFQKTQVPVYIIFSSFFVGMAVAIIHALNNNKKIQMKPLFRQTFAVYLHLLVAAVISITTLFGISTLYRLVLNRAIIIRSTSGVLYIIKRIILDGAPYFNLLFAVLVTTLFAFVIPAIVIERKKIFAALIANFKELARGGGTIFVVLFMAALLYVPVLVLEINRPMLERTATPEIWVLFIILSVFVSLIVDAIQYTAITTFYLLKKDL